MDKYLLTIIVLVGVTVLVVLYVRIGGKNNSGDKKEGDGFDNSFKSKTNSLDELKAEDFTILE